MSRAHWRVDVCVIGAGSGGLSVASAAAQLGLKVVLFEKGEMGGDCLNYGCVPSKALIAAAEAAHAVRSAERLGIHAGEPSIDFEAVMAHVRRAMAAIAPHDSQARFEGLGVTVVREPAHFVDARTVESESAIVSARKFVVATGSRPAVPPIPGLQDVRFLTNETIFDLTERPSRLLVIGGGPIGVELGQAFRRLGSQVAIVQTGELLSREDRDMAGPVIDQLASDGVEVLRSAKVRRLEPSGLGGVTAKVLQGDAEIEIGASHLLVATGRAPNVEALNLGAAGVALDKSGIITDRRLRSTNRRVFAIGDVAGRGAFTHLAGAHASLFVRNALFAQPVNAAALIVPRVTYTDPELAIAGMTEGEAVVAHGKAFRVVRCSFDDNDRAQTEGDVRGLGKLITDRRCGPGRPRRW